MRQRQANAAARRLRNRGQDFFRRYKLARIDSGSPPFFHQHLLRATSTSSKLLRELFSSYITTTQTITEPSRLSFSTIKMSYQSPYAPAPGQSSGQQQAAPAAPAPPSSTSSSSTAGSLQPTDAPLPTGTVRLTDDVYMGPAQYADGEVFSLEDVTVRDEEHEQGTSQTSAYPEPSPGCYQLPATHAFTDQVRTAPVAHPPPRPIPLHLANVQPTACLVEHPLGSKKYYILECLKCFAAFDGIGAAVMHFTHVPAHAELRGIVTAENVVDVCGCRVVDASDEDYARMSSAARVSPSSVLCDKSSCS
ncbi:hypothetical protein DL98DRAFT_3460 [Cadophora sp. DSE1049]|nr:hypothetical protein DL98DRAFT_3460 [Cadophora sp. DSE1049]